MTKKNRPLKTLTEIPIDVVIASGCFFNDEIEEDWQEHEPRELPHELLHTIETTYYD